MATIQKLMNKKGVSYRVQIRRKGLPNIFKTFTSKKDARLFVLKIEASEVTHRAFAILIDDKENNNRSRSSFFIILAI